jgi:hypothetical protein
MSGEEELSLEHFTNFSLFEEITLDLVHSMEPNTCESVITHLENLKSLSFFLYIF